ncbi:unnamed protein product [Strongylus vulgaris]|uniref:SCP domain-containing protein n=1 Tax=Strongylus vulgaris TaxID=40348 RepID=A0A3P7M1S1_STRVU|nr:unnamed protein product [Strongylus vulgaris]
MTRMNGTIPPNLIVADWKLYENVLPFIKSSECTALQRFNRNSKEVSKEVAANETKALEAAFWEGWYMTRLNGTIPPNLIVADRKVYKTVLPFIKVAFGGNKYVGCAVKDCDDKWLVTCDYGLV